MALRRASLLLTALTVLTGCGTTAHFAAPASPRSTPTHPADSAAPLATIPAATRLLDQATFGPTTSDIQHVQNIGLDAYLTEQFNTAPSTFPQLAPNPKAQGLINEMEGGFFTLALTAPDQLRQRVAFALSEIFVVSIDTAKLPSIPNYHNLLAADAFGNFQTLLHDVSLSPAMGKYLDMLNSAAAPAGQIANENYARELMQLFTIGPNQLNPDGSLVLDPSGNTVPTYTPDQVQAFARAYTGWTWANDDGTVSTTFPNATPNEFVPMLAVESAHDTGSKQLLNGTVLPPGLTAEQDLDLAIANIFNHPNVGPFISRRLIQHLVMGNPSPAYVARVAAVFNDNGHGVRGDLAAVLRAILTDPKARAGDTGSTYIDGHLREPILYLTNILRALGYTAGDDFNADISHYCEQFFEPPYGANSVFNFFPPDYAIPGSGYNAPEFANENTATIMLRITIADELLHNYTPDITIDLSATSPLGTLAASSPADLVDTLGVMFLHGQMNPDMRQAILDHINSLSDPAQIARVATFLVLTSPQYKDLH